MSDDRQTARTLCGTLQATGNVREILPKVIKLMAHKDLAVKRICYASYVRHHSKAPTEALLAVNTIALDSSHPSPLVRSLVLNTIANIRYDSLLSFCQQIVNEGLKDTNTIVRRHAVIAQYLLNLEQPEGAEVLSSDPFVTAYNLAMRCASLDSLSHEQVSKLLRSLPKMPKDGVQQVLRLLTAYRPADLAQLLDVLNTIDVYLNHTSVDIVVPTLDVFVVYTAHVENQLRRDIFSQMVNSLMVFLRSIEPIENYCAFLWLNENRKAVEESQEFLDVLTENAHLLCHKASEPSFVLEQKLTALHMVIGEKNIDSILDNVTAGLNDSKLSSSSHSHLIYFLTTINSEFHEKCQDVFRRLLTIDSEKLSVTLLSSIHHFISSDDPLMKDYAHRVLPLWKSLNQSQLLVLMQLSAQFAHESPGSRPHMHSLADYVCSTACHSTVVKCELMSTLVACFRAQPAEYLAVLKQCLMKFRDSASEVLSEQAQWCLQQVCMYITVS